MKKNKLSRLAILMLALAMASMMLVSGTYAKYTSSLQGTATGTVAKWKWTIGSDVIDSVEDATAGYTFNLFDTINDSDLSTAETDVATRKIAPGTSGLFQIQVKNDSEVNANYAIGLVETNTSSVPIEYSTNGTTWVTSVASLNASTTSIAMNETKTLTVYWRWAFEGADSINFTSTQTDITDTALGFGANTTAATVTVTATITLTQVD